MRDALGCPQSLLVLGGGSDIGRATARALIAKRLRTVLLAGRHPESLAPVAAELTELGADQVHTLRFQATDTSSHAEFVKEAFTVHGDIDVVMLAFGLLGNQEEAERDPEAAVSVLNTNFVGAASIGLHVANRLREQGHGTIVVLSSVAGERARRANFVYGSSKAGLDAFFQGLGDSLVGSGAGVLVVRPGFVQTKMTEGLPPAPFSTTPEAVAGIIVKALERGDEQVWAPPILRPVMSGIRHLPRPIFRRLRG